MSTQQTDPVFTPIPIDRRSHRLDLLPCQSCSSTNIAVATRTPYVVYVRCKVRLRLERAQAWARTDRQLGPRCRDHRDPFDRRAD